MKESQNHLLDWLRDAHAMELQAEQVMRGELRRIQSYPEFKLRVERHLEDTVAQQKLLESCINRLGGAPSRVKDLGAQLLAVGQTLSGTIFKDEVVKAAMSMYVFENLEIASYRILIASAEALGDEETRASCQRILNQEIEMSSWLLEYLPQLTQTFLARSDMKNVSAKR